MHIFIFTSFQSSTEHTTKDFLGLNTKNGEKIREDISNKVISSEKQMNEE